ncbi:DNA-binding response regulator [Pseudomethylobacillus aquaticus]|uniref:DNA-binding response regulator n=1 Tax=Pseudomethylobacillus aquaticus TaxID=2676064 RepID=A0A3N0UVH4_9PROT|nr:response regulator transcription factor [Pseudomethylobacillus aquaticus]ROH84539.1 DNA-binding response regulator [Pseudomethylobacillus aquaticus]
MRILVVDDHALFREGLGLLLKQLDSQAQLQLVASAEEAIQQIHQVPFDLVLLDWNLNGLTGMAGLQAVREAAEAARVVILSAERNSQLIRSCIDAGASGFIHKDSSPELLISAMRLILSGGVFLPSDAFLHPTDNAFDTVDNHKSLLEAFPDLTRRQITAIHALVRGLPNKLIAREMSISEDTVKQHLSAIYRILNVQNRTQVVYELAKRKIQLT